MGARILLLLIVLESLCLGGFGSGVAMAYNTTPPTANGDVNGDGAIDISDMLYTLFFLFKNGPAPLPIPALLDEPTTIFFIRHQATNNAECPLIEELDEDGLERSEVLAERFARARVTHVFASHKIRTLQTVTSLAIAQGLEVQRVPELPSGVGECDPAFASAGASIAATIQVLIDLPPGSVAVVAGHSSTIIPIMIGLGVPDDFPRDPNTGRLRSVSDFDNLWVVTMGPTPDAETQMVNLRF